MKRFIKKIFFATILTFCILTASTSEIDTNFYTMTCGAHIISGELED